MTLENQSKDTKDITTSRDNQQNSVIYQSVEYSGPLPAPGMLAKYNEVLPGAADRIIAMAENQAAHRQEKELIKVKAEARDSLLGIISAVALCTIIVGCGTAIALLVNSVAAVICGSFLDCAGIAAIVGTFLKGTSSSWKKNGDQEPEDEE